MSSLPRPPLAFCEPFCGGASIGLSVLFEELARSLVIVERDDDVAAVWETVLNGHANKLMAKIAEFDVSTQSVRAVLDAKPRSQLDRAFATVVRNRVQRGGILAPGASLMKNGENGRGLRSRWYATTLQRRIREIWKRRERITFVHGDGLDYLWKNRNRKRAAFFIDPPYTVAGRRLYTHAEVDHEGLFSRAARLRGEFLMTYDDAPPIRHLAECYGFDVVEIPMKNTHHTVKNELIIGRNLDWARAKPAVLG